MDDSRLTTLMELFERALDIPSLERAAFVTEACGNDHALASELTALLEAHDGADEWFGSLATDAVSPAAAALLNQRAAADADLPRRLQEALGDRYRIERELGGGMSRVFLAEEVALGRPVVIKVVPPEVAAEELATRFRIEIQLAAQLRHSHIVPLLASDSVDGFLYYTMPYVAGETLRERLARDGALPVDLARRLWQDILEALAHAHARGVVHRDIKPANILLDGRHALVTDFGIARAIEIAGSDTPDVPPGVVVGTPAYMAPEQLLGAPSSVPPADLYAAALVMYEMLAGRLPFAGESPRDRVLARLTSEPIPLAVDGVTPDLADLVMRCLAREPGKRPASVDEVLAALESQRGPGASVAGVGGPVTRQRRPVRSRIALGTAIALTGAVFLLLRREPPSATSAVADSASRPPRSAAVSIEAHEWYQRGMDMALLRTADGRQQAIGYLNRAIAADSTYALAWAGLVQLWQLVASDLPGRNEAAFARAEFAARRAVALDDSLGHAHAALGWAHSLRGRWAAAESSFKRAIALDRRTTQAYEGLARTYLWTGPLSAQLDAARQAVEVDPFSYSAIREYALALAMDGRCDEAIAKLRPLKSLSPPAYVAGVLIGQCHAAAQRWEDAVAEFRWATESGSARASLAFLTHALFRAGQTKEARGFLDDLLAGRRQSDGAFGIAVAYAGLGDLDSTFIWLDRSVEENSVRAYLMGPMFTGVRGDPRFRAIRGRLALQPMPAAPK